MQPRIEAAEEFTLLHMEMQFQRHGLWQQATEQSVGIVIRAMRMLMRDAFQPVKISFSHERPRSLAVHRRGADFSRWFRARFGLPPTEWIARHRQMIANDQSATATRTR
ncbi:hypothetical protein [Pseudomonas sp. R37(2017)]|uniref:hypothetical protein n=1 Tax=Pseudomonas sp. R37(2017) TaxID=1981685 RepID=UPI00117B436B|nr:hypothetical protein [Pseudomonas sp. R37(2017)]